MEVLLEFILTYKKLGKSKFISYICFYKYVNYYGRIETRQRNSRRTLWKKHIEKVLEWGRKNCDDIRGEKLRVHNAT
jgi:hypothetical protein